MYSSITIVRRVTNENRDMLQEITDKHKTFVRFFFWGFVGLKPAERLITGDSLVRNCVHQVATVLLQLPLKVQEARQF